MFCSSKKRTLKEALRFKYKDSRKGKWWLKDDRLICVAESILSTIDECNESLLPRNVEILKQDDRRLLLRFNSSQVVERSFIVKVFPLYRLRHKLKYHTKKYTQSRFGFGEAANLLIAAKRGLRVPKIYGYGRVYGFFRLIKRDIVIMEDLTGFTTLGKLLELNQTNTEKIVGLFDQVIPIFVKLYEAGCNHIDLSPTCIMLCADGSDGDGFILDFEYSNFHKQKSPELLMFEAAFFINRCRGWFANEAAYKWLDKLLDAVEIRDSSNRRKCIERFKYYFGTKLSRKRRMRLR